MESDVMAKVESEHMGSGAETKRAEIKGAMWIVFTLDNKKEIRVQHFDDHVCISTNWGPIVITPEAGNVIRVKAGK